MFEVSHYMTGPAYPAARAVAGVVEEHFARQHRAAEEHGTQPLGPLPDASTIEAIIDAAFWASLVREEGYSPKISLAFLPPGAATRLRQSTTRQVRLIRPPSGSSRDPPARIRSTPW